MPREVTDVNRTNPAVFQQELFPLPCWTPRNVRAQSSPECLLLSVVLLCVHLPSPNISSSLVLSKAYTQHHFTSK